MVDDSAQYEFKGAVTLRGMEAPTIAKWQTEGWELVAQKPGRVRIQLMFRRPKPKTAGEQVTAAWAGFRRLRPAAQAGIAGAGGMVLAALVAGVVAVAVSESGGVTGGGGGGAVAAVATPAAVVATAEPTLEPVAVESTPEPEKILTKKNSEDLAALLNSSDPDMEMVKAFADEYKGRTIAFDANVADLAPHGDYTTRYDILLLAGDYSEDSATGPYFKYSDVNTTSDLHYVGSSLPDAIGVGDAVRVRAEVGEYNSEQQILYLNPVSTRFR